MNSWHFFYMDRDNNRRFLRAEFEQIENSTVDQNESGLPRYEIDELQVFEDNVEITGLLDSDQKQEIHQIIINAL